MTEQEQIEEMISAMAASNNPFVDVPIEIMPKVAEALYNAGYRKIDEFAECRNCIAWSGTDCTRHPYTQGCLKDENNIKRQAVKEFAEKLWNTIKDKGIDYKIGLRALGEEIDELLKEYEK